MDPWAIRQTAVYQKYDTETNRSTWIFFNPTMNCAFQERLMTLLRSPSQVVAFKRQPLLIHNILLGTFFPLWRDYLAHYERKILTIVRYIFAEIGYIFQTNVSQANTNMAQRLEEELRLNHETLNTVRHAEARCLSLVPIFRSLQRKFKALHDFNDALAERNVIQQSDAHAMKQLLHNYINMVDAYTQQAEFLKSRTACLAVSITDTLSFKDSYTTKSQSQYMLDLTLSTVDDSTTVRVITIVTLIYLPSTFMAVSGPGLLKIRRVAKIRDIDPLGNEFLFRDGPQQSQLGCVPTVLDIRCVLCTTDSRHVVILVVFQER